MKYSVLCNLSYVAFGFSAVFMDASSSFSVPKEYHCPFLGESISCCSKYMLKYQSQNGILN